jgi:hypothetical protein
MMNIYLVERTDGADYDEYDAFVVLAETEEDAKNLGPTGIEIDWERAKNAKYLNWTNDISKITVQLLGKATESCILARMMKDTRIILSSFNAG